MLTGVEFFLLWIPRLTSTLPCPVLAMCCPSLWDIIFSLLHSYVCPLSTEISLFHFYNLHNQMYLKHQEGKSPQDETNFCLAQNLWGFNNSFLLLWFLKPCFISILPLYLSK